MDSRNDGCHFVFVAAYPKHSLQLYACNDRRYCPWLEPKLFEELGRSEEIIPDNVKSYSQSRHWVNCDKGPLLKIILLLQVRPKGAFSSSSVWTQEEVLWHKHLLNAPDAFALHICSTWQVCGSHHVYTEVAPDVPGGLRPIGRRKLLFKASDLPERMSVQHLAFGGAVAGMPTPLCALTGAKPSQLWTIMVPEPIVKRIASGQWTSLVTLARFLPGARNPKKARMQEKYKPMFEGFPSVAWMIDSLGRLSAPDLQEDCPLTAHELRRVAGNISRWESAIMAAQPVDDDEMRLGEKTAVHQTIKKLLGWAVRLENPFCHCLSVRGRGVYTASLLLRAFRTSTLLRNHGNLLQAVSSASHVVFPGLLQGMDENEVESWKVPSRSHIKRARFTADVCFIEFEKRTRAAVAGGFVVFGWADSTPLKGVRTLAPSFVALLSTVCF